MFILFSKKSRSITNNDDDNDVDLFFLIIFFIIVCPSDGTLNGAPSQEQQPPWHAKDRFTRIRWRVGSRGAPGKLQNFTEILPIRRKTLYNQSIELHSIVVCFYCYFSFCLFVFPFCVVRFSFVRSFCLGFVLFVCLFSWLVGFFVFVVFCVIHY